ncbi:DedA family protein [Microbacterium capsulatum]|uniref:DedA family protein n=1 Tax=Microbacterium capsulatum TaxID=3041921 RepID=A0ABU0XGV3_9MICO|nr:DedA family protein [Microbacterium sp. ASV81]MDQ4214361.1 DedA family protein [Microbacterium sp. ASV81]
MDLVNSWLLHAAGQLWLFPVLLLFFFVDGFATILPSETALVALAALSLHSGEPNLVLLGLTALVGAIAGDNMAYLLGRTVGTERWRWMRRPRVRKMFEWARYELDKRGAALIFTARYIPWGRVAVNYMAGQTRYPHPRFFFYDALACLTWVVYSLTIGLLAGRWVHDNPLIGVGIAVLFAVILGVGIDHLLRWWHRRKGEGEPTRPTALRDETGEGHAATEGS